MPPNVSKPHTEGSTRFDPDTFFSDWVTNSFRLQDNDFRSTIIEAFGLKPDDNYIYRAVAEVTLAQVQRVIEYGGQGILHKWYVDGEGKQISPPPLTDITAYTTVFSSTTSTHKALIALASNAKKASLRVVVASHLQSNYHPPLSSITIPKLKSPHTNPYYDVWTWTCQNLEWAGPVPLEGEVRLNNQAHHILPVLYHHFGCVCPSYEALEIIRQLALKDKGNRPILDIGSGNGYWTYCLRQLGKQGKALSVVPIDNALSLWRTMWVGDTVTTDAVSYLQKTTGAKDCILLLVYPQVGGDFTGKVLESYKGNTVVVAGTQNANGFTAFKTQMIAEWMAKEMSEFDKTVQIPLPSFAGKDEALFVFERRT
ncbi:hypothetical protein BJ546DRAFT_212609 [Cryomyces antarcticus]|nr:hypothetical protein LTR39_004682 [Cryomyces antarcticus]